MSKLSLQLKTHCDNMRQRGIDGKKAFSFQLDPDGKCLDFACPCGCDLVFGGGSMRMYQRSTEVPMFVEA